MKHCVSLQKQFVGCAASLVPYMEDETITDILINGTYSLYIEKEGSLVPLTSPFTDISSLFDFIERLLVPIGKRIDAAKPFTDGRCVDGSRFNVILPPIAVEGPLISIRKLRTSKTVDLGAFCNPYVRQWLLEQVHRKKNILISGGTGSGKTTLLKFLLDDINPTERIAIIEESMEIHTLHPHALHFEARTSSPDGKGEVSLRSLIRHSLRIRPDRIVLGEARGEESFEMIQAMNCGHPGSLSTIHANSCLDALKRLESLIMLTGFQVPLGIVRQWISSTVQVVIFLARDGMNRIIDEIVELNGLEGDIYRFVPKYNRGKITPTFGHIVSPLAS